MVALMALIACCTAEDGVVPSFQAAPANQTRLFSSGMQPQAAQAPPRFGWFPVAKNKQGRWDCAATCKAKGLKSIDEVVDKPLDINRGQPEGQLCVMETRSYGVWYGEWRSHQQLARGGPASRSPPALHCCPLLVQHL